MRVEKSVELAKKEGYHLKLLWDIASLRNQLTAKIKQFFTPLLSVILEKLITNNCS